MATFFIYCRQEARAHAEGDEALRTVYRLAARDEIAHTRFYQDVIKLLLEEDRAGVLADMAHVTRNFQMPGVALVPDYDARVAVMREAGIDRETFLQKVYFPVLKHLGVSGRSWCSRRARAARRRAPAAARRAVTSTRAQIEVSYDVSNEFFRLWLDERMHYTCALYEQPARHARAGPAEQGAAAVRVRRARPRQARARHRLRLGRQPRVPARARREADPRHHAVHARRPTEIARRRIPGVQVFCTDYRDYAPAEKYDALQSIEMIDHLCSPAQAAQGLAIELYRAYFARCASVGDARARASAFRPSCATACRARARTSRTCASPPT